MFTKGTRWMAILGTVLLTLWGNGCGSTADGNAGGDGGHSPGGASGTGGIGGVAGTGGSAGGGAECEVAADCPEASVCNPNTGRCSEGPLACADSFACGAGAVCSDGKCVTNETGGVCTFDYDCPRREQCIGGYCGCMGGSFKAAQILPNVMILLDKSGSMDRSAGPDSKWAIASRALEKLLDEFEGRIRFGLLLYPDGEGCDLGEIDVELGPMSGPAILEALGDTSPRGSTPIGAALAAARNYPGLRDTSRPNYVLLLTDGEERCGGNGEAEVRALRDLDPEVRTFVVGFGDGVSASELEAMAIAGGTAQGGGRAYFQADDEDSLNAAFSTIGGMVLSCSYEIEDTGLALGPDDIFVYFDGRPVAHDTEEGWVYDRAASTISFQGGACRELQTGGVEDLVIVHGCPVPME